MDSIVIINGLLAAIIAGGGTLLASVADKGEVSDITMLVAGVTALISFAKDMQSRLAEPPSKS